MPGLTAPPAVEVDAARYRLLSRLLESLAHDVRNPLNALSINLEVLTEKLRLASAGTVPPAQEKHLVAIRNQVGRVDGILRSYTDFMAPGQAAETTVDFSAALARAQEILGHESRRRRVAFEAQAQSGLRVKLSDGDIVSFLALEPLMRALIRSQEGTVVKIRWGGEGTHAVLQVSDQGQEGADGESLTGLRVACSAHGLPLKVSGGTLEIRFELLVDGNGGNQA